MIRRILTLLAFAGLAASSLPAAEEKSAPAETASKPAVEKPAKPKKKVAAPASAKADKPKPAPETEKKTVRQIHAEKAAAKLTPAQSAKLLDLINTGDAKALQAMPEIGEVRAKAIQKARPFSTVAGLMEVEGIGEATFDQIIAWAKKGMKTEAATAPEAKPKDAKPAAKSKATKEAAAPKKSAAKSNS